MATKGGIKRLVSTPETWKSMVKYCIVLFYDNYYAWRKLSYNKILEIFKAMLDNLCHYKEGLID
ncbi:MAG: hypothetical protein WA240_14715 [Nitrospirota bacterium]